MNRSLFHLALWSTLLLTGCSKDPDPTPEPTPEPITPIEVITVDDAAFQNYLLDNYDADQDGQLSADEASAVKQLLMAYQAPATQNQEVTTQILVSEEVTAEPDLASADTETPSTQTTSATRATDGIAQKIASLAGIENFKNLEVLDFSGHGISEVDLSQNTKLTSLNCSYNQLSALDLSQQSALTTLDCSNNKLAGALDVSANPRLSTLNCSTNEITALDLSANTALETLDCSSNKLTGDLNITTCPQVNEVNCAGNEELTQVILPDNQETPAEVTADEDVTILNRGGIEIPESNLKAYLLELCDSNGDNEISVEEALTVKEIQYLVPGATAPNAPPYSLKGLEYFTSTEVLKLSPKVGEPFIEDLDISKMPHLKELTLAGFHTNTPDLTSNTELTFLNLIITSLDNKMIDLSQNTKIDTIQSFCVNGLDETLQIDLGILPALKHISWSQRVQTLDLSRNTKLEYARIQWNNTVAKFPSNIKELYLQGQDAITSYDLSNCTQLQKITLSGVKSLPVLDLSACTALESVTTSSCDALQKIILPKGSQAQVSTDEGVLIEGRGGITFEYPELKSYLLGLCDNDGDGEISEEEALTVKEIQYSVQYPTEPQETIPSHSFKGLEYFTNLEKLTITCNYNGGAYAPIVTNLNLAPLTQLSYLMFGNLQSNALDFSQNRELHYIFLSYRSLDGVVPDLRQTKVDTLNCAISNLNATQDMNLSALSSLKYLSWGSTVNTLDISQNTKLERVNLRYNGTTHIICPANIVTIASVGWTGTSIDLSKSTALQSLELSGNNLSSIDVSNNKNLTYLYVSSSALTALDVSANTALTSLTVGNCASLTSIDLRQNTALTSLLISNGQVLAGPLDLTQNTNLQSVSTILCPILKEIRLPQSIQASVSVSTEAHTTVTYVP